jgi:transglutaminase-like putative cysteine protease
MELSLRYVTHFVYATPVWESHNSLRACPAGGDGQALLDYVAKVEPDVQVFSYVDNWGTRVDTFDVPQPHDELVITAAARVATTAPPLPMSGPLAGTAEMGYIEDGWRFLQPTRHTRWGSEIEVAAKGALGVSTDVVEIVGSVQDVVRDRVAYGAGATEVGVDLDSVWGERVGVCQDFAHLNHRHASLGGHCLPVRFWLFLRLRPD